MIKGLAVLVGGTVAVWGLVTFPARLLWPEPEGTTFLLSTAAAGLCLVPAVATLFWARRASRGQPEQVLLAVFGGTAARMGFVLAAGMALCWGAEAFQYQRFWLFVVLYYLVTLALEMTVVVRAAPGQVGQKQ